MEDSIIKGTGNSRYLKSSLEGIDSWEDFKAALLAGTLPIDLNGINENGFQKLGTALNKGNLLKDETAALYGLDGTAVPDDVFNELYGKIVSQHSGDTVAIPLSEFKTAKRYRIEIKQLPEASSGAFNINLSQSGPTKTKHTSVAIGAFSSDWGIKNEEAIGVSLMSANTRLDCSYIFGLADTAYYGSLQAESLSGFAASYFYAYRDVNPVLSINATNKSITIYELLN